jgi:hypothetical protein
MGSGISTYKSVAYVEALLSQRNDDRPVKPCSSSKSDLPKDIVSVETAISIQLATGRLNVVCRIDVIKTVFDSVYN